MSELVRHRLGGPGPVGKGDGHPVVVFPGLGGGALSVSVLRGHCRTLGYDAFDWGQGLNTGPKGDLDDWLGSLRSRLEAMLGDRPQQATLIGWSLGGLYARAH